MVEKGPIRDLYVTFCSALTPVEAGKEEFRIISRGCTEDAEPGLLKKDLKEGCIFSTGTRGIQVHQRRPLPET